MSTGKSRGRHACGRSMPPANRCRQPLSAGSASDADRHPTHRVDARRLPGPVDDRGQYCRADRCNRRQHADAGQGIVDPADRGAAGRGNGGDDPGGVADGADRSPTRLLARHRDRWHWCGDSDLGNLSQQFRMVLRRHFSAGSQSRRDAAIPLCRRRDCRRRVSLEGDLTGIGGWRRLGGVWRRSRQVVA